MKSAIHPAYFPAAKVTCACGNAFETGSTQEQVNTELCSACHPFFTGTQKIIDSAHRVENFQNRITKKATAPIKAHHAKEAVRKAKRAEKVKLVDA